MDDEDWTAPFTYKALGEYAVTSHGAEHPYYVRDAVNWEKAARAMKAERDAAIARAEKAYLEMSEGAAVFEAEVARLRAALDTLAACARPFTGRDVALAHAVGEARRVVRTPDPS